VNVKPIATETTNRGPSGSDARTPRLARLVVSFTACLVVGLAATASAAAAAPPQDERPPQAETTPAAAPVETPPPLEVRVGDGLLALLVPRAEQLEYRAELELAGVDIDVGRVTLDASVKPYQVGLFAPRSEGPPLETGRVHARARGEYGVYSMDSNIETLFQPQAWPALVHQFEQKGTERRRRELLVGARDGVGRASFRSDTRNGAPPGARIWRNATEFDAPLGTLDTLGAVYVVRSMVRDGRDVATLHLLDKDRVWEVVLTLGEPLGVETPAGRFQAREVRLATRRISTAGVPIDDEEGEEFTGPFGIRGQIRLYVERYTGVPLVVQGRIPAGPIDIDLDIRLIRHAGTPPQFAALAPGASIDPLPPSGSDAVRGLDEEGADGAGGSRTPATEEPSPGDEPLLTDEPPAGDTPAEEPRRAHAACDVAP